MKKKKRKLSTKTKIFKKKCHFGGRNDGIWLKNDESPMQSWPLTHLHLKSLTNLHESKFQRKKKKEHRNENFQKNAIFEADTMGFGR